MNDIIPYSLAAVAIATLYYTWRDRIRISRLPAQLLRQRVAYMMWIAAKN